MATGAIIKFPIEERECTKQYGEDKIKYFSMKFFHNETKGKRWRTGSGPDIGLFCLYTRKLHDHSITDNKNPQPSLKNFADSLL
ncbi:TPA: hypothetical protein DEP34_02885 [Candidatus Uhrbacteria bacterium]|nr:hypothetical protein [Candidatus Uhrbacteria bacterium]HCB19308.1 hypothetical protein [Candidatus Uhrbacteria bacterium]